LPGRAAPADPAASAANSNQPAITAIRVDETDILVIAQVPVGIKKVSLEGRTRVGIGTWVPRAVAHLDGTQATEVTFHLERSGNLELLRIRADVSEALPQSFYGGTNSFAGQPTGFGGGGEGPVFSNAPGMPPTAAVDASKDAGTRTVVESDIWELSNDTLYFFNQYRGLQIIDVKSPDQPVLSGTLDLPAVGEQMYLLEDGYVVLLAQKGCGWTVDGPESEALIVKVENGVPHIAARLPIEGYIQESRLVGTALYVASQAYRKALLPPKPDGGSGEVWEWGTSVSAFDLADPLKPVARDTQWAPGYGNVILATDRYLFVATQGVDASNWWQSQVRIFDISAPDGTMKALAKLKTQGQVKDKFKMNLNQDIFTVISENWRDVLVTKLENFSLADPTAPKSLGALELGQREQLHATRFDGDRVYIVTFFRVDPLFIVDLSDPANPHIAGELKVPGWSTYIQPLAGDKLVTAGISDSNDWRVAVSLFDVKDTSNPALLSKVTLGEDYSWSEVNSDEKAFGVLPEAGLILVPYQGNTINGYASRVQLIDLADNSLKARGAIEHRIQPRRATVHRDRILSISGQELLDVDAIDRDHPLVKAEIPLAWRVDRVFLAGTYLVELSNGNYWNQVEPVLNVTLDDHLEEILNTVPLAPIPVLGAVARDGKLYVIQGQSDSGPIYYADGTTTDPADPAPKIPNLRLSIFDLSQLPKIALLGETSVLVDSLGWSANLQAVWPRPDLVVWAAAGGWGGWWGGGPVMPLAAGGIAVGDTVRFASPWFWGGNGGRLFAFDVGSVKAPQFKSDLNLGTNGWWNFSQGYSTDGLVYLSHQTSEFLEGILPVGQTPPEPSIIKDPDTGQVSTNNAIIGTWVQRYFLDVIDYDDSANPTPRKPVNIPGALRGLAKNGALLYTVGAHWDAKTFTTDWSEWLDASAYDGVSASLVDSLALSASWPHPVLVDGNTIFIGRPPENDQAKALLGVWTLSDSGKFVSLAPAVTLSLPAQNFAIFGDLLAVQLNEGIQLFDKSHPSSLISLGQEAFQSCLGYTLDTADGAVNRGLWLPLGDYGVMKVNLTR
jgi:hypothetical protein